ncbi:MAG TPA: methyltransferase domain-containing protein [Vicinamibacterales bacterium]|jgi:2-polyprenyl-3-methyl-5-hydroxy-6-metoxy-1,4-benzoquinol methylase
MSGARFDQFVRRRLDLVARATGEELMDSNQWPAPVVRKTLRFLELTNRCFGGAAVVLRRFVSWHGQRAFTASLRILDVGTGGADVPVALINWARPLGLDLRVTAIDSAPDIVEAARARVSRVPEITVERCSLFDLAASGRRFDIVVASLFLHHVPPSRTPDALRAIDRLAVRGVIISDLMRSPVALVAVGALALVAGNHVVRHDGPLSVRRAFTVDELEQLASNTGLTYLAAEREGPFRVSLSGQKDLLRA